MRAARIGAMRGVRPLGLRTSYLGTRGPLLTVLMCALPIVSSENIRKTDRDQQIRVHEGTSRSILPKLRVNSYDFVYVDGSHSTADVLEDAVFSFGLMKLGGVIAFDDYLWDDPEHNQRGTPKTRNKRLPRRVQPRFGGSPQRRASLGAKDWGASGRRVNWGPKDHRLGRRALNALSAALKADTTAAATSK